MRDAKAVYDIRVTGSLDQHWREWFDGESLSVQASASEPAATAITARVDQAELRGLLGRMWDLNLVVVSVVRRDVGSTGEGEGERQDE